MTSGAMTIEIRAAEVYALATRLADGADAADEAAVHLSSPGRMGECLQAAAEAFVADSQRATGALAGELRALSSGMTAVADSWLHLDGALLAAGGRAALR